MKTKFKSKLLGVLLVLVMVLALVPLTVISVTVFAAESPYGVRAESVVAGDLTCTVDDDGVLTWTDLPGATSYDLNIYMKGGLVKSETGLTSTRYNLEEMLDGYKKDSGTVTVNINVWGGSSRGGSANFMYSSPYPKLEAPSDLKWDVNGNADWDDVANADGYTLYLYQPSGGAYNHYDLAGSYFNCTNYPDVATRISDGWYFTVRATSTGAFRPSEYNESYRRGHVVGSGLRAETVVGRKQKITFTVSDRGTLTWSKVPGATSYDLNIWTKDGLFKAENGRTLGGYSLEEELNAYKKDSGAIEVTVLPKGNNAYDYADAAYFLYSSPYGKLEAPANLYWNGNMAGWSAVDGAESYTVYLYQPSGSGYNHWTTTDTYFDFSSVATIGEDWFFAVKATASNARDSVYNESPRYTGPVSTTLYTIGAYAYDGTNGVMDSGGQVYLETNVGVVDWTSSGETMSAIEGTAVTVKAAPTPGYVFVEWRQGTQGATISREAEYSFTATGDKFLYAIFRDKGDYEIAEVVGKIAAENIPRAGMEVEDFMPDIPDGEPYSRIWNGSEWRDENGVLISANIGHHYDLGYEFEAGRTYTTDYFYFEAVSGYTFAENATVHLMGPERSMWDYEVTGFNNDRTIMYVRFTFRIPGDRTYPDINKVSMVYYGMHAAGGEMPDPARLIYNNCAITREEWNTGSRGSACTWDTSTGENRFEAGNTYVHMIELTALPGYKFSENLLAQKGMQGEEEYGVVSLSDDRTVATVTYTYDISDIEYLNTVTLEAKAGDENYYLVRQGDNNAGGLPFTTAYTLKDRVYEIRFANYFKWYDVETGKEILSITNTDLEVGKKYRLEFIVMIKDEFDETHRFGENPTLVLKDYQHANADFVQIETDCDAGATQMRVSITYTAQPKPGEGSGSYYPMICYSYNEFKYAMENPDIRFVALGDVEDIITKVEGDGLIPAISVNGIKHLNVIGNATFTAPSGGDGYKTICALLHCEQGSTLNLSGAGKLTFKAVSNASYNAVVWNQGGSVYVDGATLIGSYNTAVYGKAIWQEYGDLRISGGQFFAENALEPGKLPAAHTAVYIDGGQAWIQGGTFKTESHIDTIDLHYGLDIGQYATVDLSGGTFYGILLPTSSTPLANYMDEELYTPFSNESWFNSESEYSQGYVESGKVVRIAWLIDHVDVHINAPIAGVDITENYFNVPTSGCQEAMYYPMWYKNGEPVTYGTFEAGASYKVVVRVEPKPGYGIEFASGITAALNNRNASLKSHGAHYVEFEYDFGVCPNVISLVELTVTAPKEGDKPSYSVGLGSDAYKLVGNYNNYKDYRTWYVSNTGADNSWTKMGDSDKFIAGKYYKFVVDIQTAKGYEFPLYDDGSRLMPDVSATVNGYYAKVIKAYDQDPSTYITVEYNFGMCNDSVVEKIVVVDVVAPVAGERPTYTYNILGSGYKMNTSKNAYYDDWMHDQKLYYIKNGIGWYDVTKDDWVYENETFIPGHEYRAYVYLITEDGYEFAYTAKYYENAVTATMNGNTAEVEIWDGYWAGQRRVKYTFTCAQPEVNTIMLYDLDEPNSGKAPDTNVTAAYPELYTVKSVRWLDEEDGAVNSFEQGRLYTVEIVVESAKVSGANACVFASEMTAYIDGTKIEGWSNKVIKNKDNTVTIRYSFRKPAQAPEIEVYAFTTQPKGGELEPGRSIAVTWQTNFVPQRYVAQMWDGNTWILWLEQFVDENSSRYEFYSPTENTYRLRIVAYIGNEIVATSNEFVIIWEAPIPEYLYLYYPGEASGSPDFDIVLAGTEITLAECMFTAPEGKRFKAWAIGSIGGAQKKPGDKITINAETYIYAIWEDIPHTCVGVLQSGQKATCTVSGWNEYYKCSCGKYYTNATCKTEIADLVAWKAGAGKIAALGHKDSSQKDHKCDVCGANVGTHAAAVGKHTCDYCGKAVTSCADANKDHKCDTCGASMGTHAAAVGKHTCDYCGKTVSECADKNSDGKCDVCGKKIGDCIDANKDHKCDKHGENMGVHEAALGKHTCDYCGAKITDCADANKDHKCDTCGVSTGTHAAASGKHTCDYCGAVVTNCLDANKDHKCDTCGVSMGTHAAASGKHICNYCGAVVTDCADANNDGKCDVCGINMGTETEPAVTEPAVTEPKETEPAVTEPAVTEPAVTEPAVTEPSETTTDETVPEQTSAQVTETEETKSPETEANTTEIPKDDGCGATLSPIGIIILFALGSVGFVIFKKKESRN